MPPKSMIHSEHTREEVQEGNKHNQDSIEEDTCAECEGQIARDSDRGEAICEDCGLVFKGTPIDHGPEWRAFTSEEQNEKSRVGAPTTQMMHDKGLSTTIGWENKDAYGQALSARKQARIQRLRTWDERFRTKDAHERNLKQALGEIDRMASALGLPEPVRETAGVLYRRAVEQDLLPGRSIEGMSTASLYAAARQQGVPRQLTECAEVSRVGKVRIQRAYRHLSRELELEIEPESPTQYLPQFASSLEVSDETERRSRELLEVATNNAVHSGKSPAGLAAAALYAASYLTNERLTQETVSDVSHVSKVTIRDRYQELLGVYGEHE
jgi:transcription initiation factor TFIIB